MMIYPIHIGGEKSDLYDEQVRETGLTQKAARDLWAAFTFLISGLTEE